MYKSTPIVRLGDQPVVGSCCNYFKSKFAGCMCLFLKLLHCNRCVQEFENRRPQIIGGMTTVYFNY